MTRSSDDTLGQDLAAYLRRYPQEVTFGEEDPADVFDRYHTPDFVLTSDGLPLDRERLLAHVRSGRKRAAKISTSIREVLVEGNRAAARYVLTAIMRKGQVIPTEIFMFGSLAADGRLQSAVQVTRSVQNETNREPTAAP
ncbi:MAG: nuclear transport factor 2 family protein [Micromonosporaceae bacterium]|nr:nuclear transport factor 2 family protein [Micromonosporaceae bacterium]